MIEAALDEAEGADMLMVKPGEGSRNKSIEREIKLCMSVTERERERKGGKEREWDKVCESERERER